MADDIFSELALLDELERTGGAAIEPAKTGSENAIIDGAEISLAEMAPALDPYATEEISDLARGVPPDEKLKLVPQPEEHKIIPFPLERTRPPDQTRVIPSVRGERRPASGSPDGDMAKRDPRTSTPGIAAIGASEPELRALLQFHAMMLAQTIFSELDRAMAVDRCTRLLELAQELPSTIQALPPSRA